MMEMPNDDCLVEAGKRPGEGREKAERRPRDE